MLTACSDDNDGMTGPTPPGSGNALTIDFAKGDIAVLQFAYALEQLEADFTHVSLTGSAVRIFRPPNAHCSPTSAITRLRIGSS